MRRAILQDAKYFIKKYEGVMSYTRHKKSPRGWVVATHTRQSLDISQFILPIMAIDKVSVAQAVFSRFCQSQGLFFSSSRVQFPYKIYPGSNPNYQYSYLPPQLSTYLSIPIGIYSSSRVGGLRCWDKLGTFIYLSIAIYCKMPI